MKMIIWISVIYFFSFFLSLSDITHSILPTYVPVNSKGTYPSCRPLKKKCQIPSYRWFARYVIGAMLVDENKRFLISSFCSSTSNCTLQHCYLCPSRLVANHLCGRATQSNALQSGHRKIIVKFPSPWECQLY